MLLNGIGLSRAMDVFLVLNDLRVNSLEFGLESGVASGLGGAVGATTSLVQVVVMVVELGACYAPSEAKCQLVLSLYLDDGAMTWQALEALG